MWRSRQRKSFSASSVLQVLDDCARAFTFPVLDNGYVYLAATRLSAHRSSEAWWLVVEVFGFSPRAGLPDLHVYSFSNQPQRTRSPQDFVSVEAWERYIANNPHNESVFFSPVEAGDWIDQDSGDRVAPTARSVVVRGQPIGLPDAGEYDAHGIALTESPRIGIHELSRYLAAAARDQVLATPQERRVTITPDADELLVLDEWHHPDVAGGELPSQAEPFLQLADVLAAGDASRYRPTEPANTHWNNWPDGGAL